MVLLVRRRWRRSRGRPWRRRCRAAEPLGEDDPGDVFVGVAARSGEVIPRRDDDQHAAAAGHQLPGGVQRGAGLDHVGVRGVGWQDDPATDMRGRRVALRGQHDADASAVVELQFAEAVQRPGSGRVQHLGQRSTQQRQHRLGFGVTEPGVELDHSGPRGDRQPDVEQPGERGAQFAFGPAWGERLLSSPGPPPRREPRQRRIAHAAGVRALVVSPTRLKSWAGCKRERVGAVGDHEQAGLRAVRYSSTTTRSQSRVLDRRLPVGGHSTLAGCQAVVLDHVRGPNRSRATASSASFWQTTQSPVGTPASAITCLANDLEPSSRAAARSDRSRRCRLPARRPPPLRPAAPRGRSPPGSRRSGTPVRDRVRIARVDRVVGGEGGSARVAGRHVHRCHGGSAAIARASE